MILEILRYPHSALTTRCDEWQFSLSIDEVKQIETDLIETMIAYNGIGLAANQVGILERLVAIQRQDTGECAVLFNPQITDTIEDNKITTDEGCLSFPNVRLEIARYPAIVVRYQDRHGDEFTEQFNGIDSVCLQHEIDHLDGIVFKSYVSELKYQRALNKAQKQSKK